MSALLFHRCRCPIHHVDGWMGTWVLVPFFFLKSIFIFSEKNVFSKKHIGTCCTIRSQQEQNLRARMDERTQERQETARLHQALQVHGFYPARSFSFHSLFVQCFTCWSLCHCATVDVSPFHRLTVSPCHRCWFLHRRQTRPWRR